MEKELIETVLVHLLSQTIVGKTYIDDLNTIVESVLEKGEYYNETETNKLEVGFAGDTTLQVLVYDKDGELEDEHLGSF